MRVSASRRVMGPYTAGVGCTAVADLVEAGGHAMRPSMRTGGLVPMTMLASVCAGRGCGGDVLDAPQTGAPTVRLTKSI